jgi:hypothetical protein
MNAKDCESSNPTGIKKAYLFDFSVLFIFQGRGFGYLQQEARRLKYTRMAAGRRVYQGRDPRKAPFVELLWTWTI